MTTKTITVFWKAFERHGLQTTSATIQFEADSTDSDHEICERIFAGTNLQRGLFWDLLEPVLPATRSHTSVSVGDEILIDDDTYRCEMIGFSKLA
jgi:hypothetical protein